MDRQLQWSAGRRGGVIAHTLLAAAGLSLASTAAHAVSATWELKGTITVAQFEPSPDAPNIPVGTPFRMLVTFDTGASFTTRNSTADPVTGLPRPGIRYEYFGTPALKFALYAGDCNPCTPASIPSRNAIFVRDNFADPNRNPPPNVAYDGYSFSMNPDQSDGNYGWLVVLRDQAANFSPNIVDVAGPTPLPVAPDPRLAQMAEAAFQVFNSANTDFLEGRIESVGIPTYGTAYLLTGRDCSYPDLNANAVFDECFSSGMSGLWNRYTDAGGGPGQGDFSRTVNMEFPIWAPTPPAPLRSLGTVFASATFGGPAALPVVKSSSYPVDVARTNGNVQAYQEYRYRGAVRTDMPLVADLTYQVQDNLVLPSNPNPSVPDTSIYPGVGRVSATLAIIDGNVISAADMASAGFVHRFCGEESTYTRADGTEWPAGTVMGTATYTSGTGETGPQARVISVVRCAAANEAANADGTVASGDPVNLAPNQSFYVVTTLQTPARGTWQQAANTATPPAANGYADAASTFRVTIDPQAPAEVVQQFIATVAPACTDCTFDADYRIDIKPGSDDNSINIGSQGVIPVAIFSGGSASIYDIDVLTLRLGSLGLKMNKQNQPLCSFEDIDLDGVPDLMCHFQNDAADWTEGQTVAVLAGRLKNGGSIMASDSVRLVP